MKKQIWFTHIPKNTGSSITQIFDDKYCFLNGSRSYVLHILYNIFEEPKDIYSYFIQDKFLEKIRYNKVNNNFIKNNESQPNRMNFWHVPLSFWKPHLLKHIQEKNIIFCVIRNPYERIVSIYNFWLSWYVGSFKYKNKVEQKKLGFLFDHKQNSSEKNLNNFIEKVLSTKKFIFNLDGHLLPQFMYVYDENKKQIPEVIIRYENLKDDFSKFVRHYKLNVDIQELEKTHLLKSNSKLTIQNLNKKSIELINKYYNLDFQYLNYSKIE